MSFEVRQHEGNLNAGYLFQLDHKGDDREIVAQEGPK
jgi:hypothetical protein